MSNEELVILIQSGRDDLLPVLWEQVEHLWPCRPTGGETLSTRAAYLDS